jgi:hypothetical protein
MLNETWLPIFGYEGLYEVSTSGNVRSLPRRESFKNSERIRKGSILKPKNARGGYLKVSLCKDSVIKNATIHRLVALTFLLTSDTKKQVNHIDGDKTNNRVENLEWVTALENTQHAIKIGLRKGLTNDSFL